MRAKTNNPEDLKIIKEMERLAMDEKFMKHYDEEQVYIKTQNSIKRDVFNVGKSEGISEGKIEEKNEIAKNLLKTSLSIEDIANATGLSLEEIENLK